jgi:hypothetical protein
LLNRRPGVGVVAIAEPCRADGFEVNCDCAKYIPSARNRGVRDVVTATPNPPAERTY